MNAAAQTTGWGPESWQHRPAEQQPRYADAAKLARVIEELSRLPPVVVSWEVDQLKEELAAAQRGERFLLQGGDCAEGFADCESTIIARKLKILLQMSLVLLHGLKKPVIRVGRIAGQYAKPRSADTETRDGVTLPSYRGDIVNRAAFTAADREPDPELLLRGYERAALTLNFVRALVDGGFADLHHPEYWDLGFMQHAKLKDAYQPDPEPAVIAAFREWLQRHRGTAAPTLRQYGRGAADLLNTLGADLPHWNATHIRTFVFDRAKHAGTNTTQKLITAVRAFLRYLAFAGLCRPDLDRAVPAFAHWRLASLPQCLTADEVARLVAACDGSSVRCLRDRAILLLLVRLGLRAGDVARLRLTDIEWERGTLRVVGKGRYEVRLPLPQDAGDALLQYLVARPDLGVTDHVFLRQIAPFTPCVSNHCVSGVVKRALKKAGVHTAAKGAHLLRHTAATEMLRQGVPLDRIGLVLRHRSLDMTAYYAKVDIGLLKQVAQPWPEVHS